MQVHLREPPEHIHQAGHTREKLGGDGGIGGAFHIHAHIEDQEVIQEDIDDAVDTYDEVETLELEN